MAIKFKPNPEYLDKLELFLQSDEAPPNSMQISDLDGFLTGIAIGPDLILPSEWIPVIWGGEEPAFASSDQAEEVMSAILRRYNHILDTLSGGRWTIDPIFWDGGDGVVIASDWAEGFMDAVHLRLDAWEPLFQDRNQTDLLIPILALCCDDEGNSYFAEDEMDDDLLIEKIPELIPDAVDGIYWYWQELALTPAPIRVPARTGRNDQCPCGSGKKYKRCCGVN